MYEISLIHLKTLTSTTGVLEHATYQKPSIEHGYCTDDNASALIAALLHYHLTKDPESIDLIEIYTSFLSSAIHKNTILNRFSYEGKWDHEDMSEAAHGRLLWARW